MELALWHIWCIAGVTLCIAEIFTPVLFFLNLGIACFFAAVGAYLGLPLVYQAVIFGIFSAIFLLGLRPFFIKKRNEKNADTMDAYQDKTAKVIETINENEGKIALFGEEWQAKSLNGEIIEKDSYVKIVKNDDNLMYVIPAEK